jgi:hypothetical protein
MLIGQNISVDKRTNGSSLFSLMISSRIGHEKKNANSGRERSVYLSSNVRELKFYMVGSKNRTKRKKRERERNKC